MPPSSHGADPGVVGHRGGLGLDVGEERVRRAPAAQVRAHAGDRVAPRPRLLLIGGAVLRRVVARGVRAHPVRHRLDRARTVACARLVEGDAGHGVAGEHIVAVDRDRSACRSPRRGDTAATRDCVATGTEIAHWLFCRKKTSGVR